MQAKISDLQLNVKLKSGECEHMTNLYEQAIEEANSIKHQITEMTEYARSREDALEQMVAQVKDLE